MPALKERCGGARQMVRQPAVHAVVTDPVRLRYRATLFVAPVHDGLRSGRSTLGHVDVVIVAIGEGMCTGEEKLDVDPRGRRSQEAASRRPLSEPV